MQRNSRVNFPVIALSSISLALLVAFQNCSGGTHPNSMPAAAVKEDRSTVTSHAESAQAIRAQDSAE
jgi:hypothetical protein